MRRIAATYECIRKQKKCGEGLTAAKQQLMRVLLATDIANSVA